MIKPLLENPTAHLHGLDRALHASFYRLQCVQYILHNTETFIPDISVFSENVSIHGIVVLFHDPDFILGIQWLLSFYRLEAKMSLKSNSELHRPIFQIVKHAE